MLSTLPRRESPLCLESSGKQNFSGHRREQLWSAGVSMAAFLMSVLWEWGVWTAEELVLHSIFLGRQTHALGRVGQELHTHTVAQAVW